MPALAQAAVGDLVRLKVLDLSFCGSVTDAGVAHLGRLLKLQVGGRAGSRLAGAWCAKPASPLSCSLVRCTRTGAAN